MNNGSRGAGFQACYVGFHADVPPALAGFRAGLLGSHIAGFRSQPAPGDLFVIGFGDALDSIE
jgi:hypothetical protein